MHLFRQGRVNDLSFFEYLSLFCFVFQLNFIVLFPFLIKYYHIMFIIFVFWLGCDRPSGLLFFMLILLLSILTHLSLPSSSISLSYFILAVPMRECLEKHSCISSPFPIVILNGTFLFFARRNNNCFGRSFGYQNLIILLLHLFLLKIFIYWHANQRGSIV